LVLHQAEGSESWESVGDAQAVLANSHSPLPESARTLLKGILVGGIADQVASGEREQHRREEIVGLFSALMDLVTPDGVQASSWDLFQGAIFGRDAERVALDLVPWLKNLATSVIFSLVRLQGIASNDVTEEEAGRIHHEYRHLYVGGRKIGHAQQVLLEELSKRWGGSGKEMIYYGSVDATPQLVRLVAAYVRHHGPGILDEVYIHRAGPVRTIRDSLIEAMDWLEQRLAKSDLGLLEFCRSNPQGIKWQAMRDGALAYIHPDGHLANARAPIASLDVQGLAYDALLYAAELMHDQLPERAAKWESLANRLQATVLERFWMPEEQFFAMALDRDEKGSPRQVRTITSVPAELLETRIFDTLSQEDRERYVSAIVRYMYSADFLTEVGIRSRALRYHSLIPLWDYQGSKVSWAVTSNVFALGLRRQGFVELAEDMERRILNGAAMSGEMPEYFYVDIDGHVPYRFQEGEGKGVSIVGTNRPEATQAWTVSALLGIRLRQDKPLSTFAPLEPTYWQQRIECEIFATVPRAVRPKNNQRQSESGYHLDRHAGLQLEAELLRKFGYDT
jgi:glycogen debranching enzyme